jgi:hypothetical protein
MTMQLNNVDELSILSLKCTEGYVLSFTKKMGGVEYEQETFLEVDIQKYDTFGKRKKGRIIEVSSSH